MEQKTFKNKAISDGGLGISIYERLPESGKADTYKHLGNFQLDSWDVEITFTKKVKPEVGGTARLTGAGKQYTIVAVVGSNVWIQDPDLDESESPGFIRDSKILLDLQPWRPV